MLTLCPLHNILTMLLSWSNIRNGLWLKGTSQVHRLQLLILSRQIRFWHISHLLKIMVYPKTCTLQLPTILTRQWKRSFPHMCQGCFRPKGLICWSSGKYVFNNTALHQILHNWLFYVTVYAIDVANNFPWIPGLPSHSSLRSPIRAHLLIKCRNGHQET